MNTQNKLTMQMAIFFLIVFVLFGTIIVYEKKNELFLPKIENSINEYINENYSSLELKKEEIKIEDNTFIMKVMNKTNNNLYFYITYSNKKIKDTYQEDYEEGKTIINYLNNKLQKEIKDKTNLTCTISINNSYNNFSSKVKELLLEEKNIESLKIYTLETEIYSSWDYISITNKITDIMTTLEKNNITPKNYTIVVTDLNDITKSVKITNLTNKLIENNNLSIIINDIINNNNTSILNENEITYEYLN